VGWIKLARQLVDNLLFTRKPHCWLHVWMTILLRVNWRDGVFFDGTEEIAVPAGSWVTSVDKLATNTRTKRQTIRGLFGILEGNQVHNPQNHQAMDDDNRHKLGSLPGGGRN
jgi:hypothetical protein